MNNIPEGLSDAIAIMDKSASRTTPNAQTAAWKVLRDHLADLQLQLGQARASLADARRDAERFRFLNGHVTKVQKRHGTWMVETATQWAENESLADAIDAAIAQQSAGAEP